MGVLHNNVEDPYQALNLPHTAGQDEIKRSYRQLAKKYHPDTWSAPCFSEAEQQNATSIFQKISAANEWLTDPAKKADYDRNFRLGLYRNAGSSSCSGRGSSVPPRRPSAQEKDPAGYTKPPPVQPPRTGAPPPLPRGWTTAKDPISGSLYYCNASTGRSSWNHPSVLNNCNSGSNSNAYDTTTPNKYNDGQRGGAGGTFRPTKGGGGGGEPSEKRRQRPTMCEDGQYSAYQEHKERTTTTLKPDAHRHGAFIALWLCPPIGIIAVYHSIMVDRCWDNREKGQENNANNSGQQQSITDDHSKRAAAYTWIGNSLGIVFWTYMLFFRGSDFEWPKDWSMDDWWPDDWDWGD